MSDNLVTVCRCPYCPAGRGVVAVDPAEIRSAAVADGLRARPGWAGCAVFDPDRASGGPCPHLIQLEVEAGWLDRADDGDGREVSYRHPALAAAAPEPGHHLWSALRVAPRGELVPATPFRLVFEDAEGSIPDVPGRAGWEWYAWLSAIFAADAARFVQECQARHRRVR